MSDHVVFNDASVFQLAGFSLPFQREEGRLKPFDCGVGRSIGGKCFLVDILVLLATNVEHKANMV
jgi:hypothetical protein